MKKHECDIRVPEIKSLSRHIFASGVTPLPEKVDAFEKVSNTSFPIVVYNNATYMSCKDFFLSRASNQTWFSLTKHKVLVIGLVVKELEQGMLSYYMVSI